jgi:virginiamycin B lyase
MAVVLTPSGVGTPHPVNVDLTVAANPNCTSTPTATMCTISMALAPGSFTASFTTYDGLLNGSGNPTGHVLSANQSVPLKIVAGAANTVGVTLDGVPASVAILPAPGSALGGSQVNGFTLSKCAPQQNVTVLGVDADGNDILGAGAPAVALGSNDAAHLAVASPPPYAPNTFALSRPAIPDAHGVVQLTATVTPLAGSGAVAKVSHVNVTFNGDVCGVFTEYPVPTVHSELDSIVAGSDGALWFTECNANKIGRITTGGAFTEFPVTTTSSVPNGIAAGADGALWFAERFGNNIGRITTGGTLTEYPTVTSASHPNAITAGPDGALWFTEISANNVGQITTGATPKVTEYPVTTSNSHPFAITAGPDGALWFVEANAKKIGRITTAGTITNEFALPNSVLPDSIVTGSDGALWFVDDCAFYIGRLPANNVNPTITTYPVLTPTAYPAIVVAGPDGALWFTEAAGKIARLATDGSAETEYAVPTAFSTPQGMTVGPDGALWFTEFNGNKIGRLQ